MKRVTKFTNLLFTTALMFAINISLQAQLNHQMIFRVNGPSAVAGDYNFGEPANGSGHSEGLETGWRTD